MYQVAIDGPAGTGKSTTAKLLADKLGITHLDSGAAYRAFTLHCFNKGFDFTAEIDFEKLFEDFCLDFVGDKVYLNEIDVSKQIRTSHVSENVCNVAGNLAVRQKLTAIMKKLASQKSVVMDGRDVATNILKDADYKFFINASLEVRTERRLKDLQKSGEKISYDELYQNIKNREHTEYTRSVGALVKDEQAIEIDNTYMTIDEVVDEIITYIDKK